MSRAAGTYRDQLRGHRTSMVAFRQPAAYHFGVLMLEQTQRRCVRLIWTMKLFAPCFGAPKVEDGEDVRLRLIRDGSPELARLRTDRGLGIANPIVSAFSRGFWEFTFKAEYAYDYGMPQWVAQVDHAFGPLHLERLWMGRHKLFHFRWWYRTILAKYVQEMLLDRGRWRGHI